jgi:transcriptional regulator with XRE-family HTH domain
MTSSPFGTRLTEWRERRRESQLSLALAAGVSQRHISFMESGRAQPSREMVVHLSEVLDLPLRARNELLAAAGFAPLYAERPLADAEMRAALAALERIITHHEPFPALVVDRAWRIVMHNRSAGFLMAEVFGDDAPRALTTDGQVNFMRMMFEPTQMRPRIRNWGLVAQRLIERLRREAGGDDQSPSARLLRELQATVHATIWAKSEQAGLPPTLNLELQLGSATLRLFNTITTFGTPQDVGLHELRIEMSFPCDVETETFFERAAARPSRVK